MPRRLLSLVCQPGDPPRLDAFLLARLPSELPAPDSSIVFSNSKLRRLIMAGAISLSGQAIRNPAAGLRPGSIIQIRWDPERFAFEKPVDDIEFAMTADRIIYEDEWILVVNKPAGLPSEATMVSSRNHLHRAVCEFLAKRDGLAEAYLGQHHRLDRDTSGLLLYSKKPEVNPRLHQLFLGHDLKKTYVALTGPAKSPLKPQFRVHNRLARISPKSQAAKWGARPDGLEAITDFTLLDRWPGGIMMQAQPQTGRTHQIRVHLASVGLPILGDELYGGARQCGAYAVPRVMLHAQALDFPHPRDGRMLSLQAGLPIDFQQCLDALRRLKAR